MADRPSRALANPINGEVLRFLEGKSAHSDVSSALAEAVAPLGDTGTFCPAPLDYGYVAVITNDIIFAVATGVDRVAFRLNADMRQRALRSGAEEASEIGPDWVSFVLFRNDWPEADLRFWALKAYVFARNDLT